MKILLLFTCCLLLGASIHARPPGVTVIVKKMEKKKRHHAQIDPCTVTTTQSGGGWYVDCDGNAIFVNCTSSCSRTADDCTAAYNSSRTCAQAAVVQCLASIVKPACP